MKTVKAWVIILFLCCLMALSLAACDWNDSGGSTGARVLTGPLSYEATAAAGERQLNIQLTAIAGAQRAGGTSVIVP